MRSYFQLPKPMSETGLGKEEKRKFNQLLKVVERLIPKNAGSELLSVTDTGTVREKGGSSSNTNDQQEGRWL